jgi:SAM-dependent methyltransferase
MPIRQDTKKKGGKKKADEKFIDYALTVLETIFQHGQPLAPILQSSEIRNRAFGRFWVQFSTGAKGVDFTPPASELEGSSALVPPLLKRARGVVLDIGPGSGTQMPYLVPALDRVSAIYGAEPCVGLHATLRRRILNNGLDGKYHVVTASAAKAELLPALDRQCGVSEDEKSSSGIFDTIICVRVLCSVPEPERAIADLYTLLRPGGQMLVLEHVVNPGPWKGGGVLPRMLQIVYHFLGWTFFMGDCHLNRDTRACLLKAADRDGGWESAELEDGWRWSCLPYISGVLTKKKVLR